MTREISGRGRRTAVLIAVGGESVPDQAFDSLRKLFGDYFDQIIFITAGIVDYATIDQPDFRSSEVGDRVRQAAQGAVTNCVQRAREAGMTAVTCVALGTDPATEVERLCIDVARRCRPVLFFLGKMVFENRRWYHAFLHDRLGDTIQKRLESHGVPLAILPVVVPA